jgi:hypothetical protein
VVGDGNGVIEAVAVGGTLVLVGADVIVGTGESVMMKVEVGANVEVAVGKLGTMVTPGVRVGTLGTQSNCPV